ncbi:MAG: peptidase M50, partial [Thermoprotei archaeon ex4572_64]
CFKAWTLGLLIAIILSVTGIVIAAPGAVYIGPKMSWKFVIDRERLRRDEFYIALAGPLTNIVFATVSMILLMVKSLAITFGIVFTVNASLAFFNLLPLPMLDGLKIAKGNLIVWILLFLIASIMFFGMIILR